MALLKNLASRSEITELLLNTWAEKMCSLAANCLINEQI
jgi:hypothetical protein